jgi:CheY-like chemotaxis protein
VDNDHYLKDDWQENAEPIFLQFSVADTGRGLTEEERHSLFNRFTQASPRTHIKYGGSGLGLFISRQLTELQGGAIGLSSEFKRGSTFSFYIKTRPIDPAKVRKDSSQGILPEDIKHRPHSSLPDLSQSIRPTRTRSSPIAAELGTQPLVPEYTDNHTHYSHSSEAKSSAMPDVSELALISGLHETSQNEIVRRLLHVLVVEDNLINQKVLAKQLRNSGCVVHVANHGGEALEYLERTVHWNRDRRAAYSSSRRTSGHIPCTEPLTSNQPSDGSIPIELGVVLIDWEM